MFTGLSRTGITEFRRTFPALDTQWIVTHGHMSTSGAGSVRAGGPGYSCLVTSDSAEVRAAQRLRYRVLAEEMGAAVRSPEPGLDVDGWDAFCDHLIVRDDRTGEAVGTYRMLAPDAAERAGGLYADGEFDLAGLDEVRGEIVETGRTCVHPDHRHGTVMNLMWTGVGRYMTLTGYRWVLGCASVPLHGHGRPYGQMAAGVWDAVAAEHLSPSAYRVRPRQPWDVGRVPRPARPVLPPLLRGYLRIGAWVCGPPAHDPDFGVADFLVLLCLDRMSPRHRRYFLGRNESRVNTQ